ncbi:hypothetical protein RFI_35512 [Reticulomyxa filosa]|uniref:Uncharacterized protein n=1 Tax=Reticulomyxa filosa TaxID=46433 RepID=X6LLC8_RETFI|nr:hypothetical protein RFI_35512 [Reticulomyxa filosa]|eukprot:ETO01927.1 hypothetical protein RFI_35512 [Reticulomyxa filosa]
MMIIIIETLKTKITRFTNKWIPFVDNCNNKVHITNNEDNYEGVHAIIYGSDNNLFITYQSRLNVLATMKKKVSRKRSKCCYCVPIIHILLKHFDLKQRKKNKIV